MAGFGGASSSLGGVGSCAPSASARVGLGSGDGGSVDKIDTEANSWQEVKDMKSNFAFGSKGKSVHFANGNRFHNHEGKMFQPCGKDSAIASAKAGIAAMVDRKVFDRRSQRPSVAVSINPNAEKMSWIDICTNRRKFFDSLGMSFVLHVINQEGDAI